MYNAEISAGSLMPAESRRIAKLLLGRPTTEQWNAALKDENLLQKKPSTAKRQARLIKNRLDTLDDQGLRMVVDGDGELAGQVLLASAIRHSRLLGDFMRDVYAADLRQLEKTLRHTHWDGFIAECENRDESVGEWAVSTKEKLFQVVVRILTEAKYIDSTRKLGLTLPMLHPEARRYLKHLGDADTLARMEGR